ncbi:MAG: hypothetical protein KBF73_10630 [Flavobacteriales bacterium]|nr:hypothetical protein [Flavobacteriales bacterium]
MKVFTVLFLLLSIVSTSFSQSLEYSEVRWGLSDTISKQLHIKEVLPIEGVSKEELRDRTIRWLNMQLIKGSIIEWGTLNGQVGHDWWVAEGKPYDVDGLHRIWTKYMMCKDCVKQTKNSKTGSAGFYKIDFRFKDGKMLMVMSGFYSFSFKMTLDNWMVDKGQLALDENDPRVIALTDLFKLVREDFKTFIAKDTLNHSIDNW